MQHILIIAETPEMEAFLVQVLGDAYALTSCCTPEEGAVLLGRKPDGLVLSLSLRGGDGLTWLRDNAPFLPPAVLGLTAFLTPSLIRAVAQLGVGCLIRVPCTGREIASRLAELLGKKDPSLSGG